MSRFLNWLDRKLWFMAWQPSDDVYEGSDGCC